MGPLGLTYGQLATSAVASSLSGWAAALWCEHARRSYEAEDDRMLARAEAGESAGDIDRWVEAVRWQLPFHAVRPETARRMEALGLLTRDEAAVADGTGYGFDKKRLIVWPLVCLPGAVAAYAATGSAWWAAAVACMWGVALVDRARRTIPVPLAAALAVLSAVAEGPVFSDWGVNGLVGVMMGCGLRMYSEKHGLHEAFGTGDIMLLGCYALMLPGPRKLFVAALAAVAVLLVQLWLVRTHRMEDRVALAWTVAVPVTLGVIA